MVRVAKKDDLPQINSIRRQVHLLHSQSRPDVFKAQFGKDLEDILSEKFENNPSSVIVFEDSGKIKGFALTEAVIKEESPYNCERSFFRVVEFGVDKNCRRQGIGTEIFDFIKDLAKQKHYSKIELDMWEFNENALQFYQAQGFKTYRRYLDFDL